MATPIKRRIINAPVAPPSILKVPRRRSGLPCIFLYDPKLIFRLCHHRSVKWALSQCGIYYESKKKKKLFSWPTHEKRPRFSGPKDKKKNERDNLILVCCLFCFFEMPWATLDGHDAVSEGDTPIVKSYKNPQILLSILQKSTNTIVNPTKFYTYYCLILQSSTLYYLVRFEENMVRWDCSLASKYSSGLFCQLAIGRWQSFPANWLTVGSIPKAPM